MENLKYIPAPEVTKAESEDIMNTTSNVYFRKNNELFNSVSTVYTPKSQCKKAEIKWFDDSKLIKKISK